MEDRIPLYDKGYGDFDKNPEYSEFIELLTTHNLELLKQEALYNSPSFTGRKGEHYRWLTSQNESCSFEVCYLLHKAGKLDVNGINKIITMWHSNDFENCELAFQICLNKYNELLNERTNKQ